MDVPRPGAFTSRRKSVMSWPIHNRAFVWRKSLPWPRAFNAAIAGNPGAPVDLTEAGGKTRTWTLAIGDADKPWVAAAIADGRRATRAELFGTARQFRTKRTASHRVIGPAPAARPPIALCGIIG